MAVGHPDRHANPMRNPQDQTAEEVGMAVDNVVRALGPKVPLQPAREPKSIPVVDTREDPGAQRSNLVIVIARAARMREEVHRRSSPAIPEHMHEPRLDTRPVHLPEDVKDTHQMNLPPENASWKRRLGVGDADICPRNRSILSERARPAQAAGWTLAVGSGCSWSPSRSIHGSPAEATAARPVITVNLPATSS
jgi:hypothetical protein